MKKMLFFSLLTCVIFFGITVPNVHSDSNLPMNSDGSECSMEEVQSPDATPVTFSKTFEGKDAVFNFAIKASGDGTLTVETMDCCIVGDKWGLKAKGKPKAKDQACGSGSTSAFSGAVVLQKLKKGKVKLYYCSGTDIFPAGMTVRFSYTGTSFTVTPK